tara:strand:+ start:332 stop:559 length:228 start_codon:yes stop_codon:yes gene_type:complete
MTRNGMYFAGIMAGTMIGHVLFDHVRKGNDLERRIETQEVYQGCEGLEIQSLESEYDVGVYCQEGQIPVIMVYEE